MNQNTIGNSSIGPSTGNPQPPAHEPASVADVMTRDAMTLSSNHSFAAAVSLMAERHFHHIVIVDTRNHVVGVISDRDILRALARTPSWDTTDLSQVMTRDPVTVKGETPLPVAVSKMLEKHINCFPVVDDDGTVCGILTSTDLLKSYHQLLESLEK